MYVGGWTFEPTEKGTTIVKNFAISDLKGMIPKFVISAGASTHATIFVSLRKMLDEMKTKGTLPSKEDFVNKCKDSPNFMNEYEEMNKLFEEKFSSSKK